MRHAVLGALSVRPSSGYELVTRFNTSLRHVWFASQGAIYAEVNRLEADGLVAPSETGPRGRTTYTVTDTGLSELRNWLLAPPKREPRSEFVLRTFSLWLLDDDEALVFLVQRLLRRRGYEVSGFTDPHQATAALREAPHAYDLLVTDYNMPGFCGVDLVREARLIRPDLPVALASGYVTAEIEQAALAEGARALIHKPNDVEELCATVQRLVAGDDAV